MTSAYYNECDPRAAAWLRELICAGEIAPGDVDERPIQEVAPDDLKGYTQCHFFAGIGGWSFALRLAGWPDTREVWTGSCPCQPFSSAGKGKGFDDERHLWPVWFPLIAACEPPTVFGEQVASAAGRVWLGAVFDHLEALAYRRAGADLCAAGVGAPHIRQRLFWVADTEHTVGGPVGVRGNDGRDRANYGRPETHGEFGTRGEVRGLADNTRGRFGIDRGASGRAGYLDERDQAGGMEHSIITRLERLGGDGDGSVESRRLDAARSVAAAGATRGAWANADWLLCRDSKIRPVEPGSFPLAYGLPARVGRLRGYGNAIVPQVAAEFIKAVMDVL